MVKYRRSRDACAAPGTPCGDGVASECVYNVYAYVYNVLSSNTRIKNMIMMVITKRNTA